MCERAVCNVRWLGLRSAQMRRMQQDAHGEGDAGGEPLTADDWRVLRRVWAMCEGGGGGDEMRKELLNMQRVGKFELQWVYGQGGGLQYVSRTYVTNTVLRGDYV